MSELVEWLTKILDEDEEVARDADGAHYFLDYGAETGEYLDRFPASAALADIAAKRAIIALHGLVEMHIAFIDDELTGDHWCVVCGSVDDAPVAWPCDTLRLLTSAYADRHGYREEWRPAD